MATVNQLSRELLRKIFDNVESSDLVQAQKVCCAWYPLAHVMLLKDIHLHSWDEIEKFIAYFDQNTNPTFLTAVKKIEINDEVHHYFDISYVEGLFCRFPNLTYVSINCETTCLEGFDEEICQMIKGKCPKLNHFEVILDSDDYENYDTDDEDSEATYCRTLYKLRSLLTTMNMSYVGSASGFGGVTKFITSFPRLKHVYGMDNPLDSFQAYFPILEQLPSLMTISLDQYHTHNDNEENFAEKYLSSKTKEQQHLLIDRLSEVTNLWYTADRPFCSNSMKFVAKYLTGLKQLTIDSSFKYRSWTSMHQQSLVNDITNIKVQDNGSIKLRDMHLPTVAEFLPSVVHRLFHRLPSNNRILLLDVKDSDVTHDIVDLHMQWPAMPQITIASSAHETINILLENQFSDIDHFIFHIRQRLQCKMQIGIRTYQSILQAIPSLKKVTFDIPTSYRDKLLTGEPYQSSLMETLTLRLGAYAKIQSMLRTFSHMFPNLKQLNLYYYCVSWIQGASGSSINLENFTLNLLKIDLTQVKRIMKAGAVNRDFFAIQVETLEKKQRYKVSVDLYSATSVDDEDIQDCFCVYMTVNELKSLDVYMYSADDHNEVYLENAYCSNVKRLTIFK